MPDYFSPDRPIASPGQDRLSRAGFAAAISSAIRGWSGRDSLVIALYGPWGSGKSSVKNMILASLRASQRDCPSILEFDPWQMTGQERLAESFFGEVGTVLGTDRAEAQSSARAAKWKAYGALLSLGATSAKSLKTLLPLIGVPGSPLFGLISEILGRTAKVAAEGSDGIQAEADVRERSLAEIKADLAEELRKLDRPILIVMDDIDRLATDEIRLLMQLVKANADFPNLIYLLLFQRDVVEKSLGAISAISGRDFLEKIVQVGFDLPPIRRTDLEKILCARLDQILGGAGAIKRFDQYRWRNLFYAGLLSYFETLRDVNRFGSTLDFHVALFRGKESFEVNPVDLIALEVLRVFEPDVYGQLPLAKGRLTGWMDVQHMPSPDPEINRKAVQSICDRAPEATRPRVGKILSELFPLIGNAIGMDPERAEGSLSYRELRVCNPDIFDRYFQFALSERDLTQAEVARILAASGDRARLVAELEALDQRGIFEEAIDALDHHLGQVRMEDATPFVTALLDIGDRIPPGSEASFSFGRAQQIIGIVRRFLLGLKDAAERAQILKTALADTQSLSLPAWLVAGEEDDRGGSDARHCLLEEADLPELRRICLKRIIDAASENVLHVKPGLACILAGWGRWGSLVDLRNWAEKTAQSTKGALALLVAFSHESSFSKSGDVVPRVTRGMNMKGLERFVSLETLMETVRDLPLAGLGELESDAVVAFQTRIRERDCPNLEEGVP